MKKFIKNNMVVWIYIAIALFAELFSICFANCLPYLSNPLYFMLYLFLITTILILIPNKKAKSIVASMMLFLQIVLCIGFIFLYESNGTIFDFSMLNQRNDAFGALQGIDLNILQTLLLFAMLVTFIVFVTIYVKRNKRRQTITAKNNIATKISCSIITAILSICMLLIPVVDGIMASKRDYEDILYNQNASKYQSIGITANAIYEMVSGLFSNRIDTSDIDEIASYLYGENEEEKSSKLLKTSQLNGISENKNLIMIMVESFDWYVLNWYDAETTAKVYPNITKLFMQSLVLDNFHSREKTDTSENNALLGSNPSNKYMNYDFPNNEYPFALPNMYKAKYKDVEAVAYHANKASFYNRDESYKSLGFDKYVSIVEMEEKGVENTWKGGWSSGEWVRDSEVMKHMVEDMFPTDRQFMTYWLTVSMHGFYKERKTFREFTYVDQYGQSYDNGYYGYFDELGIFPESSDADENHLRTYAAAVKDFDCALGIMMNYLEKNNLLDDTTICLYSDHNTYYSNLAYYGKNIKETYNSALYRVPCILYDKDLVREYNNIYGEDRMKVVLGNDNDSSYSCLTLSKFTTHVDLIPTLLDMFGIKGWDNLYLGNSIFLDEESIVYSRAYGIFVTDKLVCFSVNNLLYTCDDFTEEDKEAFIIRAEKHLHKKQYIDKIFYSNYFKEYEYKLA